MRFDSPERVGRAIVRAIERDATVVYPRGPERLFVLVQRLVPRLIDAAIRRKMQRLPGAERIGKSSPHVKRAGRGSLDVVDRPQDAK
jgi:hypothetical protein